MNDKLLRASIKASGFEIEEVEIPLEEIKSEFGELTLKPAIGSFAIDYKLTKRAKAMMHPVEYSVFDGDLFSLGCQVDNDDIKDRLKLLGFELDKDQMHEVMEAIIFHIARPL